MTSEIQIFLIVSWYFTYLFLFEFTCLFFMIINEYDINEYCEGAIILDGLDEAIIGIVEEFGNSPRILYSKDKILQILQERDSMTYEESEEYYDFNILGLYAGEQNPVFAITVK